MPDLRYPIGPFVPDPSPTPQSRTLHIAQIAGVPERLRRTVAGLSPTQLDTPYREGGWTVRQVVHHLPDSHLNACLRLRLALTEEQPTVKPYEENLWAQLPDAKSGPVEISLVLLDALHDRWVRLWRALTADQFGR